MYAKELYAYFNMKTNKQNLDFKVFFVYLFFIFIYIYIYIYIENGFISLKVAKLNLKIIINKADNKSMNAYSF